MLRRIPVGKTFTSLMIYTISNSPDPRMLTMFNHYKVTQPQLSFSTGENPSLRQKSMKNETKNTLVVNNQRQSSNEYTDPGKVKKESKLYLEIVELDSFSEGKVIKRLLEMMEDHELIVKKTYNVKRINHLLRNFY